jgi:hypothetical protein
MTVAAVPASPHTEQDGRVVWFCGPGCLRAYRADPAAFDGGLASSADWVP